MAKACSSRLVRWNWKGEPGPRIQSRRKEREVNGLYDLCEPACESGTPQKSEVTRVERGDEPVTIGLDTTAGLEDNWSAGIFFDRLRN